MKGGVVAVVPAAGQSSRFGSMKLVALIDGQPLLDRTLASLLKADVATVTVVTSPDAQLDAVQLLRDARVRVVVNPDPARGMFSSIQSGLAVSDGGGVVVVLPADMPFVAPETVKAVAAECVRVRRPVIATYGGRRGHPVALPGSLIPSLLVADANASLKDALAQLGVDSVHLGVDDAGVLRDVDVRADLG